ncbi:cation transporter [Leptothermofonsia sichuanensis E412]|uniref:cation diffusion facilitator family transporter n=1 Tax=Leptothermofonsia sichuanensis TaxID=2917832 RepID=UPI001CA687DC|nr:cation diffusion facilitator family transporter [Leptothermofonsia sichuanensis]QZZ21668.1 cation transporter [Leptothermofonsia sichuanensis E412]
MHYHAVDCPHHAHQDPAIDPKTKQFQLAIALLLIGTFAIAEFGIGLVSHSLALVAEAGHLASDSLALVLALLATWIAQLPRSGFAGKPHLETVAALVNGTALLVLAGWIGWEAIEHLKLPAAEIASLPMLLTAIAGTVINGINVALLHRGSRYDLNLKAAFLHVLADTVSSIGVVLAAIAISLLHWFWVDGAISLFVAGLIFFSALPLVIESIKTLWQPGPASHDNFQPPRS